MAIERVGQRASPTMAGVDEALCQRRVTSSKAVSTCTAQQPVMPQHQAYSWDHICVPTTPSLLPQK